MPPKPSQLSSTRVAVRCYIKLVTNWEGAQKSLPAASQIISPLGDPTDAMVDATPSRVLWEHSHQVDAPADIISGGVESDRVESEREYAAYSPILERYAALHHQQQPMRSSYHLEHESSDRGHQNDVNINVRMDEMGGEKDNHHRLLQERQQYFPSYDPSWDSPFVLVPDVDLATDTIDRCAIKALAAARRASNVAGGATSNVLIPSYDIFFADKDGYVVGRLPSCPRSNEQTMPIIGSVITQAYATAAKERQKYPDMSPAEAQQIVDSFSDWTPIPPSTLAIEVLNHKSAVASLVIVPKPPYSLQVKRKAMLGNSSLSSSSDCVASVYSSLNACVAMRLGVVERQHKKDEKARLTTLAAVRAANVAKVEEGRKSREIQAILKAHKVEDTRLMEAGLAKKELRGV